MNTTPKKTKKHAPTNSTPVPSAPVSEVRPRTPEASPVVSIPADEVRSLRISVDEALEHGRELLWLLAEVLPTYASHCLNDDNAARMRWDLLQALAELSSMTQGLGSVGISLTAANESLAAAKAVQS